MIDLVHTYIIPAAYSLLPAKMASKEATALLLTIGLQESRFKYRTQIGGPAHGFWQFEKNGGCKGVLTHPASKPHLTKVLKTLGYTTDLASLYEHIVHNDVLAAVCARLLLWTSPTALPTDAEASWELYISTWRPGKPHRETWNDFHAKAWEKVN